MSEACVCHLHTNAENGKSCTITINDLVAKRVKHDVPIQICIHPLRFNYSPHPLSVGPKPSDPACGCYH